MPTRGLALLRRATKPQRQWSKDDLCDTLFMLRMLFALFVGVVYGYLRAVGVQSFLAYLTAQWFFGQLWIKYQNVDVAAYDSEKGPLTFEGLMPSVFMALLTWTISYTLFS